MRTPGSSSSSSAAAAPTASRTATCRSYSRRWSARTSTEPGAPAPGASLASAVVVGAGAVGSLLSRHLAAHADTLVAVDLAPPDWDARDGEWTHLQADIGRPTDELLAALGRADLVVLAIPEPATLAAVEHVAGAMLPGSLLVDTTSVKTRMVERLAALDLPLELLSLNPMFAPSLGFAGQRVVAVAVASGVRSEALLSLIRGWGADVAHLSAEEHDRAAAALQAATHAAILSFGDALERLGADPAALRGIAPPPHRALLALLARVASGEPEVYWDVQRANPYAAEARMALADGVAALQELVDAGDREGFAARLAALADHLGPARVPLAKECTRLFEALRATGG